MFLLMFLILTHFVVFFNLNKEIVCRTLFIIFFVSNEEFLRTAPEHTTCPRLMLMETKSGAATGTSQT